jgi:hypothetical protein
VVPKKKAAARENRITPSASTSTDPTRCRGAKVSSTPGLAAMRWAGTISNGP